MAPPSMVIAAAQPTVVHSSRDSKGLVSTGQLSTLLPNAGDVTNVLESMKRVSDAKYRRGVQAYPSQCGLEYRRHRSRRHRRRAAITKAAYIVDRYNNPAAVNPDVDPNIVGSERYLPPPRNIKRIRIIKRPRRS